MTEYRCRFIAPRMSAWSTLEADSPELAANECHCRDERSHAITYTPDASKPGANIHFALVEVEHHGSWVSKIYTSGIMRRGRVKARPAVTLVDVAKAVRWERDPSELLEDGWIGEEPT